MGNEGFAYPSSQGEGKISITKLVLQGFYPLPSGKLTYGKSPCLMGKLTISMAIFNSYVSHIQRVYIYMYSILNLQPHLP